LSVFILTHWFAPSGILGGIQAGIVGVVAGFLGMGVCELLIRKLTPKPSNAVTQAH
jgi:hypothetical protein